jgi:hypothetical protein
VITRRKAIGAALLGIASGEFSRLRVSGQDGRVELTEAPIDPDAAATPFPEGAVKRYTGDVDSLWNAPWEIGTKAVEIGVTIVQRFIGDETEGYVLGLDGLVFQSVIYAKHDYQEYLFIGVNSDLSEIKNAKTLIVTGNYGGVQHNTRSGWDDPIIVAHKIEVPN